LAALKTVVSWFSYLFHLLLALLLLGFAGIAFATGPHSLHLDMLPWSGQSLEYILGGGALFDLLSLFLAVTGRLRFLFVMWSVAAAVVLTKGYIFSSYRFGPGELRYVSYLIAAAWVAVAGASLRLRAQPDRGPRKYRVR
jgi:hypothetical protein